MKFTSVIFITSLCSLGVSATATISSTLTSSSAAFSALWYRPHDECGWEGSNATQASLFINDQMKKSGIDFVGISGYGDNINNPIGIDGYGSVGSVCGNPDDASVVSPIVLFHNKERWDVVDLYPKSSVCQASIPTALPNGPYNCGAKTIPSNGDCCSCTYSDEELAINPKIVQRPWAAGLFEQKLIATISGSSSSRTVCVVVASLAHPSNTTESFGAISPEVNTFCRGNPVVFMADTNLNEPSTPTSTGFREEPLLSLKDYSHGDLPYTCCNDTYRGEVINQFASDRIAVSSGDLSIDDLFGGSAVPGLEMPLGFGYQCHNMKEHAPLLAHVSFQN